MKIKFSEWLYNLTAKAKVDKENPQLKEILAIPELSNVEISSEFADHLNRNLISFDDAKKHPDIRSVLFSEIMDGFDSSINKFAEEAGLPEDARTKIKALPKTTERLKAVMDAVKANNAQTGTEKEWTDKVNALNLEIGKMKADHADALNKAKLGFDNELMQRDISGLFSTYTWASKDIDPDVNVLTAKTLFDRELASKNLKVVRSDNGQLELQNADGTHYFDANRNIVPLRGFIDGLLAEKKLLAVTKQDGPQPPKPGEKKDDTPVMSNQVTDSQQALNSFLGTGE